MTDILSRTAILVSACIIHIPHANAITVFDNYDTGMTFDYNTGGGFGSQSDTQTGMVFTPSQSGYLSDLYVSASNYSGTGDAMFILYNQIEGRPGDILETFRLSTLPDFNTVFSPQHINASGTTFLDSAVSYWLVASQPNYPDTSVWNYANTGGATVVLRDGEFDRWWVQPHERQYTLRVDVSAVPLPPSIYLFIAGYMALFRAAKLNV